MTVDQFKEKIRTIVKKVYVPKKEDTPIIDFEEFQTFPELNQLALVQQAAVRQKYIDQTQ